MWWFFVFCIVFVISVITVTIILVRRAVKNVGIPGDTELKGRETVLWEEEEEDDPLL